ncbi:MAG: hypothetical protein K2P78_10645 [Gemmataceae bacterium]|nr:hypothetical protein [Gemmataceae bacterium]
MNGFVLAALVLPVSDVDRPWEELLDGITDITRMAEPYLRVQPTDTPAVLAYRHRLAQLVHYVGRFHSIPEKQVKYQDFFNLIQIERDLADAMSVLSHSPAERLACQMAMWSAAKKAAAYNSLLYRRGYSDPPAALNQGRAQVELFQTNVRWACALWAIEAFRPLR